MGSISANSLLLVLLLALGGGPANAQPAKEPTPIETIPVAPGLAMLVGLGGNLAVSTGADGPVIVDDQFSPQVPGIVAAVRKLQDAPIRFVINTHHHFDHTGGNEALGRAGALILAHDNVRARLSREQVSKFMQRTFPPSPPEALPVVTFGEDVTLHWNGETISVEHAANAHTDGDAHVWFEKANAVHTGDTFVNGFFPFVDVEGGGSVDGLLSSADRLLARATPDTRIIPGHGPLAARADLERFRAMVADVKARVEKAIAAGATVDSFVAEKPLADLDAAWGGGFIKADQVIRLFWTDLAGRR